MYGLTNSVNLTIEEASGGGDVVYAVNETGGDLSEGDKVWLNTERSDGLHTQNLANTSKSDAAVIFSNGGLICRGQNRCVWNGQEFVEQPYASSSPFAPESCLDFRADGVFRIGHNARLNKDNSVLTLSKGFFLNNKYAVVSHDYSSFLREYDPKTGQVSETDLVDVNGGKYGYRKSYYMPDDSLEFSYVYDRDGTRYYVILNNVLDAEAGEKFRYTLNESLRPVWYTDGYNDGSYVICLINANTALSANVQTAIYKFSGGEFKAASDLPESLQNLTYRTGVTILYNDDTKVLTAFDIENAKGYAYKFANGKFIEIPLPPIALAEPLKTDRLAYMVVGNDFKTIAVNYAMVNGSSFTGRTDIFELHGRDGKWHATPAAQNSAITLTGFATGKTNAEGDYEVETMLPQKITLTFNVTPEPEILEVKGISR